MYIIDSYYEHPDIEYMRVRVTELMQDGIAVNNTDGLYKKLYAAQEASAKNIRNLYGITNPNSYNQVVEYFKGISNSDILEACYKGGKWTTDRKAMVELAIKGYQEAIDLLTYRKASSLVKGVSYFRDYFKTHISHDNRVRPLVSLGKTNRINYAEPPLMNIPKELIWHIIAPRKSGNILISVDIKNQEPWIMINMLDIKLLKGIIENNTGDLYENVFNRIFNRLPSVIERNEFKVAWNALTYGCSIYGIREICRHCDGETIYKFFNDIPEFKKYRGKCFGMAKKNVQQAETYFGTIVRADKYGPGLNRILMDIPIQGTGADILALLIKHFDEEVMNRGLQDEIELFFTRHDELIVEVNKDYVSRVGMDSVKNTLADILEHRIDNWEPFQVKIGEVQPGDLFVKDNMYNSDEDG